MQAMADQAPLSMTPLPGSKEIRLVSVFAASLAGASVFMSTESRRAIRLSAVLASYDHAVDVFKACTSAYALPAHGCITTYQRSPLYYI